MVKQNCHAQIFPDFDFLTDNSRFPGNVAQGKNYRMDTKGYQSLDCETWETVVLYRSLCHPLFVSHLLRIPCEKQQYLEDFFH